MECIVGRLIRKKNKPKTCIPEIRDTIIQVDNDNNLTSAQGVGSGGVLAISGTATGTPNRLNKMGKWLSQKPSQ